MRMVKSIVCMVYYRLRGKVCGGDFPVSLKHKNTRASSFHRCFSILRSHKGGIIYTRFHTFMLSSTMAFMWWKKNG